MISKSLGLWLLSTGVLGTIAVVPVKAEMVKGEPKSDVIEPSAIAATPKTKGL